MPVSTVAPEAPFLGLRIETNLDGLDARVAILGVPHGWPYPRQGEAAGCADAPRAVRRASQRLARFVDHWDFDLDAPMAAGRTVDVGDVEPVPGDPAATSGRTTEAVAALLERGAVPICIGGDDSVPIPILRAFADRRPLTVVQVDAHLDFRDEVQGVREGYSSPMRRASEMPHVARIVQVGLRGVGSARARDVEDARAAGNALVTAAELRSRGVAWVVDQLTPDAAVFVSLDLDGLDPSVAPAVSAPSPGGLSHGEAMALITGIGPRLVGAVVTEYVPDKDPDGQTGLVAARLAIAAAVVSSRV